MQPVMVTPKELGEHQKARRTLYVARWKIAFSPKHQGTLWLSPSHSKGSHCDQGCTKLFYSVSLDRDIGFIVHGTHVLAFIYVATCADLTPKFHSECSSTYGEFYIAYVSIDAT